MIYNLNLNPVSLSTDMIRTFFISVFIYFTFLKITFGIINLNKKSAVYIIITLFIAIIVTFIRYKIDFIISRITLIFLLSLLFSTSTNKDLGYAFLITVISLSINYILLFFCIGIDFLINIIFKIQNDYINLTIIIISQSILLYNLSKIKRIKNGISFFNKNYNTDFLDIIILNMSVIILFCAIIFVNMDIRAILSKRLGIGFIIIGIIMFVTIKKSIQLYYKQKLMIKELEETKSELEKKTQEVEALERENLEFSKKSHSLAHKQKALEYKINQLTLQTEVADEIGLKEEVENVSKELFVAPMKTEITKTEIEEIDDMLATMQAECEKNNIEFSLQVNGNIHHMINNLISKEELAILLADHIKDAIIAINHSDNLNRTILVKLGKIDEDYGVYVYDSGIEFEKETLESLGKKPVTTHKDEGGTGMGFMNTFDTLRKHNASLIINEIGKPSKENFTKVLEFKFDGRNEFKVESYR